MKRKVLIITISYILGLIWGLYFNINIVLILCLLLIIISILKRKIKILFFIFIIMFSCIYNKKIRKKYDSMYINTNQAQIVGTITGELGENEYYKKYIINVESVNNDNKYKNTKLLMKVKKNINLSYGNKLKVQCEYENSDTSRNYRGYNYNEYLRSKHIYGIIAPSSNSIKIIKVDNSNLFGMWLYNLKSNIKEKIYKLLPSNTAEVCIAIILGDKSNVDDITINEFSESNLSHILAISGMHMMYIIIIFSFIFKFLGRNIKNFSLIIIIIIFCNLVGNSESIIRATIMTIISMIASVIHRKSDSLTNISIAGLIILILNPYSIKSLSFILSFGGTLGIIIFHDYIADLLNIAIPKDNKVIKYIKNSMIISISANLIIIPVIAIYFNKISFTFIFSNIFANMLMSVIMPLIIILIFSSFISMKIAGLVSIILNFFLNSLVFVSKMFSKIEILNITIGTPYTITLIMYYLIIFFKLIKSKTIPNKKFIVKKILKLLIAIYLIIVTIIKLCVFFDQNMYIHFVDVGQGDCTLIITKNNKKILVDGGGSENGDDYIGEKILMPYLLDRKIKTIDYIMISHFDSDHCKGILYIIQKLKVKNVIISRQGQKSENYNMFLNLVKEKNINVILVESKMKIKVDTDTYLNIIWPESNLLRENILNNNSIVAKLEYKDFSILFTGDIEELAEESINQKYNLQSTVLKIAHHGSKTSSSEEFLQKVNPKIALIGVGKNNKFGHPSESTLNKLNKMKIKIYRTDIHGEVTIKINKYGKITKIDTHL